MEEFRAAAEGLARCIQATLQRRHHHQTARSQVHHRVHLLHHMSNRSRGDAMLGNLPRHIHLNQHIHGLRTARRLHMNLLRQSKAVHGVNESDEFDHLAHLVALHRADHVPANIRRRAAQLAQPRTVFIDLRRALHQLLHAILAEVLLPKCDQLADLLDRRGLRHHDQLDLLGAATTSARGIGHASLNGFISLAE